MEIIRHADSNIIDFLGGFQKYDLSLKYRLSNMLVTEPVNNEIVAIWNTFTKSCLYLKNEDWENIFEREEEEYFRFLVQTYCIVPTDYDEIKVIDDYRKTFKDKYVENRLKWVNHYVILTTTDCNARCFYCYEKGCNKINMTEETANKVSKFIIEHYDKESVDPVTISWFGGEPLYNKEVIEIITNNLREANVNFRSDIITNGLLFDENTIKTAVEKWNIKDCQITLDGTEKVYNKVKNYTDKSIENPYEVVLNHIAILKQYGVRVNIRMNVDKYNYEDMKSLIKELHDRFGTNSLICPYVHEIFENEKHPRTEEENKELAHMLIDLNDTLYKYGYLKKEIDGGVWFHACMVDSGNSLLVSPLGKLGLCEHYTSERFIADIETFDEKKDWDEINRWKKMDLFEECHNCPNYPFCYKMNYCDGAKCNKYLKESFVHKLQLELRNAIKSNVYLNSPVLRKDYNSLIDDFSRLYEKHMALEKRFEDLLEHHSMLVSDFSRLYERTGKIEDKINESPAE